MGSWGIYIFALWALALAVTAFARLLLLTKANELYQNTADNQGLLWLIFIMSSLFGLGFAGSAYGLWKQRNWGRVLFLWLIVIWSGLNLMALLIFPSSLSDQDYTISGLLLNVARFAFAMLISLAYFNLAPVKARFKAGPSKNFTSEE